MNGQATTYSIGPVKGAIDYSYTKALNPIIEIEVPKLHATGRSFTELEWAAVRQAAQLVEFTLRAVARAHGKAMLN